MRTIIGLDIGGTHTDGVVIDAKKHILARAKTLTTEDLQTGLRDVLRRLTECIPAEQVSSIRLGTTHGTNALLQRKGLERVGLLRLAGHRPALLPPAISWPKGLRDATGILCETVGGGYECDGRILTPLSPQEVIRAVERLLEHGATSLAIVGVFAPLCSEQEIEVQELLRSAFGTQIPMSLSHEIGGLGFMERENATLLNSALHRTMSEGFTQLEAVCQQEGFSAPLHVTQNDGSLLSLAEAIRYPILTLATGPTNSFVGGSRLAGRPNAIIVDIGGTSTDVGLVRNGFPVRSMKPCMIGGVGMQISSPDLLSIALGGGSLVCSVTGRLSDQSVGREIHQRALCFGGTELTLTDIALRLGHLSLQDSTAPEPSTILSHERCKAIYRQAEEQVTRLVQQMRGKDADLPCIFVGGGSALFSPTFALKEMPTEFFDVANAYGAALAEIAGSVDTIVSLSARDQVLSGLHEQARQRALDKGADPKNLRLIDQQVIPYPYAASPMARVIIRWSG